MEKAVAWFIVLTVAGFGALALHLIYWGLK